MKKARHSSVPFKRILFLTVLVQILSWTDILAQTTVHRCATMEAFYSRYADLPQETDPLRLTQEKISSFVLNKRKFRIGESDILRIPVVVHVVHNQESGRIGGRGNSNISDDQIQSQIRILNEDYRRISGTPGFNDNPVGVDTRIEFFLAELDPDGAQTTGVTRSYYADKSLFDPDKDAQELADIISWPTDEYLNIWTCQLSGTYLGVAQFPSLSGIPGLDNSEADLAATDGVIIDYRAFGDIGAVDNANYNQGRTTTHEIGHWLGLLHTWGDRRCGDDYCDDTPWAETSNLLSCNDVFSSCFRTRTRNMIENYMDYSPDRCMNTFTFNQMERMNAVLELSPRRIRLVENAKRARLEESDRLDVLLFPNPVTDKQLQVRVKHKGYQDVRLSVFDMQGRSVSQLTYQKIWSRLFRLPVSNLSPGMYILEVTNETREKAVIHFIVN